MSGAQGAGKAQIGPRSRRVVPRRRCFSAKRAYLSPSPWDKSVWGKGKSRLQPLCATKPRVFLSSNGWYAIVVDIVAEPEAPGALTELKAQDVIPDDAYCSTGQRYTREVAWRSVGTPALSGDALWSEFDGRPLSKTEKRFLQAALALEGTYTGLLDGAWGSGSQRALERYTWATFQREPLNADAAFLALKASDTFSSDGWEYREVDHLAISLLLPTAKLQLSKREGMEEVWNHSEGDMRVVLNDLGTSQLVELHRAILELDDIVEEPYVLRQPSRWISSVRFSDGTVYLRSDLIMGTWSTVLILAGSTQISEVGLISSSIRTGPPVRVVPEPDGLLFAYSERLADALLQEEREEDKDRPKLGDNNGFEELPGPSGQAPEATSTGTGFSINKEGVVLTNAHVVEDCQTITVDGVAAERLAVSESFDLAALSASGLPTVGILAFAPGDVGLNSDITIAGFPLHGLLGGLNVSRGSVNALKGVGGDERSVQISAPVQPGNSGGPVLDRYGRVVGVVVAKLDALEVANATGDIAQNVNFAIRASIAKIFLSTNGIDFSEESSEGVVSPEAIARLLQDTTHLVECER